MNKISFEVLKEDDCYLVICNEMNYESYTKDPQSTIQYLVREWFELDMGNETPDI
jgi:hypothetical protein